MVTSIYQSSPSIACSLSQGEILSGLVRFKLDLTSIGAGTQRYIRIEYPYVVVLSQACDLTQDYTAREEHKPPFPLPDVLFCHLPTAEELRATTGINSAIWERVRKNKDERYHFLERIPAEQDGAGTGIPELTIDFKRYFTVPTDEVYQSLKLGITQRRSILCSPYLEHLSSRFGYFLSRIGLPFDHTSE